MYNLWFWIIIAILLVNTILSYWLKYLNLKALKEEVPAEFKDIYDAEKYAKSQQYTRTNTKFSYLTGAFSFIIIMLMLFFKGFAIVDNWVVELFGDNYIITPLIFFFILFFANDILNLPFEIYDTFVIEEKFGFNKVTKKTFITDKIKGFFVAIIIGALIGSLILKFYDMTKEYFWIYAWLLITFFSLFMMMFYSNLIVPLFNKQKPLQEGELRDAIEDFAQKAGFKLNNIYVINGSKRSTKANAYFTGLGPKKRIVLYDTLIQQLETKEIVAVLAHEIGHYKHKHSLLGFIISMITTAVTLYIFALVVKYPQISEALGATEVRFHIALIAFVILYAPISMLTSILANVISRKNEYQADNFAKKYNMSNELISGLKKLSVNSLSNLTPHKAYVFFHYSHPPLIDRINNLKKAE